MTGAHEQRLAILKASREQAESAGQTAMVAAIDVEIETLERLIARQAKEVSR